MNVRRDEGVVSRIRELPLKGKNIRYCVVGAGHGGMGMAGHLAIMGYPVTLYNRSENHLSGVKWHGGITVEGEVTGFGPIPLATSNMAEALESADVVMIVTPSTAHRDLAVLMADHLMQGQLIVLNPGRTGGALEFSKILADRGVLRNVVVAEAQTFIYASRAISRHEAHIFKIKNGVALAALPSYLTPEVLDVLEGAYPQFKAGGNVLATSLENIGAVFHPALTILNAGWIEETKGDFEYYLQGITPSIALVLERIDAERLAVARCLGLRNMSAVEWLYLSYSSPGKDLYEAIHNTLAYRGIKAPPSIDHRYIFEDVPMSLVPIASLGRALGAATPTIDMIIDLGCMLHGVDYRASGRTIEKLGLAGLSVKEILEVVV